MQYDKEQFIWDVINEALAIRENATQEERNNLNYFELNASNIHKCIYGQMTGHCNSDRSLELIRKCCTRYFKQVALRSWSTIDYVLSNVNGVRVDRDFEANRKARMSMQHFSAVEIFIATGHRSLNANLIAYLRGETDELDIYF